MKQAQIQKDSTQIDKRILVAILRAVAERNSFVVRYSDIYDQLRVLAVGEEFYGLENKMHEAISEGLLYNIYKFPGPCKDGGCEVVVVSPEQLNREALEVIEYIASLYQFRPYDGSDEKEEVDRVIRNFVKMQTSSYLEVPSPARAVYEVAKIHGLAIQEEMQLDEWGVGKAVYKIKGISKSVVKEIYYCNRCLSFYDNEEFIEKRRIWVGPRGAAPPRDAPTGRSPDPSASFIWPELKGSIYSAVTVKYLYDGLFIEHQHICNNVYCVDTNH
jgi:hypothetical protein